MNVKNISGEFFVHEELSAREYVALCAIGDIPKDDPGKAVTSLAAVCAACVRNQDGTLINPDVEYWLDQPFSVIEECGHAVLNSASSLQKDKEPEPGN